MSGYDQGATPPAPPPKPDSHEASRMATPSTGGSSVPPPPPPPPGYAGYGVHEPSPLQAVMADSDGDAPQPLDVPPAIPDPGEAWLPETLQDKSIQDLAAILASPPLLQALTHAPASAHPSLSGSHAALSAALSSNAALASRLAALGRRLSGARSATQARLLATHALERQWRQRQSDMDHALAPFSPTALYQALAHGVQEQAQVCQAMEDSFLDGGRGESGEGGESLTEREVAEWVKGYREAKVLYYQRQERKERWDEGRVGGWR